MPNRKITEFRTQTIFQWYRPMPSEWGYVKCVLPNHFNIVYQQGLQWFFGCWPLSIVVPCLRWYYYQSQSRNDVVIGPTLTLRPQYLMWWNTRIRRTWNITNRTLWPHQLGGGCIDAPIGLYSHQRKFPYEPCLRIYVASWRIFPSVDSELWTRIWSWKVEGWIW